MLMPNAPISFSAIDQRSSTDTCEKLKDTHIPSFFCLSPLSASLQCLCQAATFALLKTERHHPDPAYLPRSSIPSPKHPSVLGRDAQTPSQNAQSKGQKHAGKKIIIIIILPTRSCHRSFLRFVIPAPQAATAVVAAANRNQEAAASLNQKPPACAASVLSALALIPLAEFPARARLASAPLHLGGLLQAMRVRPESRSSLLADLRRSRSPDPESAFSTDAESNE